jgi:predicted acetyltransferase
VPAATADHLAIHQLLTLVFHGPSVDQFHASLDDPLYEPGDRLLVKRGQRIVAHVHLTKRLMRFGRMLLPVADLSQLATLPEFRGQGCGGMLLDAAHAAMARQGAVLGLLRTRIPHFFRPAGWAVCGRHSHSKARAREILAQLVERRARDAAAEITVRPWRQVELPALMRLHEQNTLGAWGAYQRTEAAWRWLISTKGFDRIFVAIQGPDRYDLYDPVSPIVGYVVTKDDQILELVADRSVPQAAEELLARACSEAIERDQSDVQLHAPPDDPLHRLLTSAGGAVHCHETYQGALLMARLVDPVGFLDSLCPELHRRAEDAGLSRPCELGLLLEGVKHRLVLTRRSVKRVPNKLGRSYLTCNLAEFTRMVMGQLDFDQALACGRIEVSTRLALATAKSLFPTVPYWRAPVDHLLD